MPVLAPYEARTIFLFFCVDRPESFPFSCPLASIAFDQCRLFLGLIILVVFCGKLGVPRAYGGEEHRRVHQKGVRRQIRAELALHCGSQLRYTHRSCFAIFFLCLILDVYCAMWSTLDDLLVHFSFAGRVLILRAKWIDNSSYFISFHY